MEEEQSGDAPSALPPAQVSKLVDLLEREGLGVGLPDSFTALQQVLDRRRPAEEELRQTRLERDQLRDQLAALQQVKIELEQKHAALFHHNTDAIFSVDTQGRFTNANSVCVEMTGYTLPEFLQRSLQELCAPDQLEHTLANFRQCLQGNFERLETAMIRKDGKRVELLVYGGPIVVDGKIVELHCAAKDITQWKSTTDALRKSEERRKLALESTQDAIWDWEPHHDRAFWSAQFYRMLGYAEGEIEPNTKTVNALMHPDDAAPTSQAMDQHLAGLTPMYKAEFRLRHKDGSYRWVLSRARAIRDEQGRPIRVVGSHADITDRKRAQEERDLLLAKEQESRRQLEEANRSKDRFLAILSHELRTPLTPVLTTIQMMERDPALPAAQLELVQMIRRNVELEARLIDDLLDVTRISRGKMELFLAPTDVHVKIRHVAAICDSEIRSKQLSLAVELNAPLHHVQGDAARLQQVFWNLLKNAVKFTPDGSSIGIRTRNDSDKLVIDFWDTGIGIEPDLLPMIFNAFEQGGREVTRKHGGLGLGLSISRGLIEAHRGTIRAISEGTGMGSVFSVLLPLAEVSESVSFDQPRQVQPRAARQHRLLLVEDNADTTRAMKRLLTLDGYIVHTADSVSSALRAADGEQFDLLICDIGLPDGSGLDLMRQLLARRPVDAIALSGYGMEEDINRSKAAGFIEHLTKPVNLRRLEQTIVRILGENERAEASGS